MELIREQISRDRYLLESGVIVCYNALKGLWEAQNGDICKAVLIGSELVGFSFRRSIGGVERHIHAMTEDGLAYLEYNSKIGGEPFGFTIGMPVKADPDKYGGIAEMYRECIRQGITWEELLQWSGHSDELPLYEPQNGENGRK